MIFTYIAVDASGGKIREQRGLIESDTPKMAFIDLISKGFYVREIRAATIEDIKIDRLKKFRNKLAPQLPVQEQEEVYIIPRRDINWALIVTMFLAACAIGVIIWLVSTL